MAAPAEQLLFWRQMRDLNTDALSWAERHEGEDLSDLAPPLIVTMLLSLRDGGGLMGDLAEVALAARLWRQERKWWRHDQPAAILTRAEERLAAAVDKVWP